MPRRNLPIKHTRYVFLSPEKNKVRYASENSALKAAEIRMLQTPGLELAVYQATDGGWYLTSKTTK